MHSPSKLLRATTAAAVAICAATSISGYAQARGASRLITQSIDDRQVHTLRGNTRAEANADNDLGRAADGLALEHMQLQLKRSPERDQAAEQYLAGLHDTTSPNYRHWLTAAEYGQQFGAAQADIDTITSWLHAHGFTVNTVYPNALNIDFSGTAGQVRSAFHTEIHHLDVEGAAHVANMSDPQIPEALANAVKGVVSLHDFTPHPMKKPRPAYTYSADAGTVHAMTPGDLATIYNFSPLFAAGTTGAGQSIVLIEDTDLYKTADWATFRSTFGLSSHTAGKLSTVHPAALTGQNNCADPGVVSGDDGEAILDAEWASAAAPDASIVVAACANTRTTFGGFIALQNLLNSANPPAIVSISYGECEAQLGAAGNAAIASLYQQGVAEGVSIFVSAGDEGAASCDAGASAATHGIGVSGFASTPYNVAVGGTDFADTALGTSPLYWNATNSPTFDSALSYIPEIPWNDSCASSLLANHFGYATPYGAEGFCATTTAAKGGLLTVASGSGGPSGCASGAPAVASVVGGTCAGYAKPSWQSGVYGIPSDGVRDLPDVSLFSASGVWGHYYVTCWSNTRAGGAACTGAPSTWSGAGGTSFAAPILAGVQALVNQRTGARQGNPNYAYYRLAAANATCDAFNATAGCIFHNVSQGDIDVNCSGSIDCFGATATSKGRRAATSTNGALSLTSQSYAPAFPATTGWNFATGIGSIDATGLVNAWGGGA